MSARSRTKLQRVVLVLVVGGGGAAAGRCGRLAAEMPSLRIETAVRAAPGAVVVDHEAWSEDAGFVTVDRAVERSGFDSIVVRGPSSAIERVAIEALTRCQRFVDRRNRHSCSRSWDAVRDAHEALHDRDKPLVAADLDHAIDTWQWVLRLSPDASLAVQLAALFHDIERLESEADRRVEHHAADYVAFKVRHARRGADRTFEVLRGAAIDEATAARVRAIVAAHERRGHDAEVDLLNDADALSFFSLNSPGYADYFGPEQTRRKVAYTLARLGPAARTRLAWIRLREDVRAHLVAAGERSAAGGAA